MSKSEMLEGVGMGWRIWDLVSGIKGDTLLSGIASKVIWAPRRPNYATHDYAFPGKVKGRLYRHPAPQEGCLCGFNFFSLGKGVQTVWEPRSSPIVVGEVYGWGKTVLSEDGFRVQIAYPRSLYGIRQRGEWVALKEAPTSTLWKLARLYKVPIVEVPLWLSWEES